MDDNPATDALLDATTALLPPLLDTLEALARAGRRLHPPDLPALVSALARFREPLAAGLRQFESVTWPEHLARFQTLSREAAGLALEALRLFDGCLERSQPVLAAYGAMGAATRAVEALYPVSFMLPPVNRFFLCAAQRQDQALQHRLLEVEPERDGVGVMHASNAREERGGFSLYVPEYLAGDAPAPLVVALHGGSGHGRAFLWTWLTEARSRGALVLAPTSRQETWSLMAPDVDLGNLLAMIAHVKSVWPVHPERVLLTGMSDGGTFAYLAGLQEDAPFTHLAPVSASFHPLLLEMASAPRLRGLPVYLVHGARDWMFPVESARMARDSLAAAGARVTYREIGDLSHTYPREQNERILAWLTSA